MRGKYQVALLALLAVALLTVPTTMRAGTNLGMSLSSNPDMVTLCDNNVNFAGCTMNTSDMNPALGQITFIGPVGNWTTNITSGLGPPFENLTPVLDISSFNATSAAGAAPMTILLSVIGLTSPTGIQSVLDKIGGTSTFAGTTITTQAWVSPTNVAFCASTTCGSALTGLLTVTGGVYSGSINGVGNFGSGPFALTLAVTINSDGQVDTTSFDNEFDIPEPAALSLLGSGLLGLGLALRKKLLI
jgi:hypothetical protein